MSDFATESLFHLLCKKSGFVLKNGDDDNKINIDKFVFQRNLTTAIKRHSGDRNEVIEEFLDGFSDYISNFQRFHKSLLPTLASIDCDRIIIVNGVSDTQCHILQKNLLHYPEVSFLLLSAPFKIQDSIVRILLGVNILQPPLMKILLDKLLALSQHYDVTESVANIPRLLLGQIRWLGAVVDSKALTSGLLELMDVTTPDIQREIISAFPSVVNDSDHSLVATKLKDLLVCQSHLTIAIVDALSCLDLAPDVLIQVRGAAIHALKTGKGENLAIVVKFLLKTASNSELSEVITEIRNCLDLTSVPKKSNVSLSKSIRPGLDDGVMILDAIQSAIRYQSGIAEAWIKVIDSTKNKIRELDIVVLLILHQTKHRKAIEGLLRNKIRCGMIHEELVQSTFHSYAQVIEEKFKTVLSLSEVLMKSSETDLSHIGQVLYKLSFIYFIPSFRQEIIANLVSQIGSSRNDENDLYLNVLADLVEYHIEDMAPFTVFFKRLLDFQQQNMSLPSIRKLFRMLAKLAFCCHRETGHIQDNLHMVIRKYVSSDDSRLLSVGVAGGVMMVQEMIKSSEKYGTTSDDRQEEVVRLLKVIQAGCSRYPQSAALFLDQLATMVTCITLLGKIETWILENMIDMFQDHFVVDMKQENNSVCGIPMSPQFSLQKAEESCIVINLLPVVAAEILEHRDRRVLRGRGDSGVVFSACLSPHFRLVQRGERRTQSDSAEGIDALLGCPIYMPDEVVFANLHSMSNGEKDVLCTCLFHALNWFIEVVNAFAGQSSAEMKLKVVQRLHCITRLSLALVRLLAAHPSFNPAFYGLCDEGDVKMPLSSGSHKPKPANNKKSSRKRKRPSEHDDDGDKADTAQQDTSNIKDSDKSTAQDCHREEDFVVMDVELSTYSHCFRELDIDIFTILRQESIPESVCDSEFSTQEVQPRKIEAPQLRWLLEDLVMKLKHSLVASIGKRRTFFVRSKVSRKAKFSNLDHLTPDHVGHVGVGLLPDLCGHLEASSAFFQAANDDDDVVQDGLDAFTAETAHLSICYDLLLQAMLTIFSWDRLRLEGMEHLLRKALTALVSRMKVTTSSETCIKFLVRDGFRYIQKFEDSLPNLRCAVSLVQLLSVVANHVDDKGLQHIPAEVSSRLLQREWLDGGCRHQKGAEYNDLVQTLVKKWLVGCEDHVVTMQTIVDTAMVELLADRKRTSSATFPTLTRNSFNVFLRVVLSELVDNIRHLPVLRKADSVQELEHSLSAWGVAVKILSSAVSRGKEFDSRAGIAACLKYGRQFVEVFLLRGMPILDATFPSRSADVHTLLRSLQQSTRSLQNMCGHVKRTQDVTHVTQVPLLKRALERLVLRVKQMLTLNNCRKAFWIGNLKNRTLKGEEILSQAVSQTTSGGTEDTANSVCGEEDEEMIDDEESDVDKVGEGNCDAVHSAPSELGDSQSYSTVY